MRYRLGHRIVWYMVLNVLEEHSGFVFTGILRWMQNVQTEISVPTVSRYHNVENYNFKVL